MTLRPGALLGMPAGVPDVVWDLGPFRYLQLALVVLWIALARRGRPRGTLAGGLALLAVTLVFWTAVLGRPYGLLVDPAATARAATLGVVSASGSADEGPLAGEPLHGAAWTAVARLRPAVDLSLLALTWAGPLATLALPLLLAALLRPQGALPALLWIAFGTGTLDALAGLGFVSGAWARPLAAWAVVAGASLALFAGRRASPRTAAVAAALVAVAVATATGGRPAARGLDALLALTLVQGAWLPLAALGFHRGAPPAAAGLAVGGGLMLVASAAGAPVDEWTAHALYRLGLVLAGTGPVAWLAGEAAGWLAARVPRPGDWTREGLSAGLVLALVPGSFLGTWNPKRMDAVFDASVEPISPHLLEALDWIRSRTDPREAVLAAPETAPAVAALAGRRVLRAPLLGVASDDERRRRLERAVLTGRETPALADRYGLRWVLVGPGEFASHPVALPEDLEGRGGLARAHATARRIFVYALPRH